MYGTWLRKQAIPNSSTTWSWYLRQMVILSTVCMGRLLGWLPMQLLLVFVMHSSWATDGWPVDAFPFQFVSLPLKRMHCFAHCRCWFVVEFHNFSHIALQGHVWHWTEKVGHTQKWCCLKICIWSRWEFYRQYIQASQLVVLKKQCLSIFAMHSFWATDD